MVLLRPAARLRVIDPATGAPIPPEGGRYTLTTYWRRRIADGSVEVVDEAAVEDPQESAADLPDPQPTPPPRPRRGRKA